MIRSGDYTIPLLLINTIGVVAYLYFSPLGWVEPQVADIPGAVGGGAMLWGLTALPIFLLCQLINVGAGITSLISRMRWGDWTLSWPVWILVPIWIGAVAFDVSHHGIS